MPSRTRAALILVCLVAAGCASAPAPTTPAATAAATPTRAPTTAPTPRPTPSTTPEPTPSLVAADLDGTLVDPELAHRLPLAVSIDDARAARPQSGFNGASLVYHAPADGYEARYLLVFQEGEATDIGPVRSGRLYLVQWAAEARAVLAHYGGDRVTRAWISKNSPSSIINVDGLGGGNAAYHRISSRKAPHNAYTSTADLRKVGERLGGATTIDAEVHVRPFREDTPGADHPASQSITVPFRTVSVGYAYDPATNAYRRSLDGKAHVDPMDGQPVTTRTVVVMYMTFRTDSTIEPGHARPVLGFVGHGTARVFMEGREIAATWSKAGPLDPTLILGPDGKELPFIRGRIFFEAVPTGTKVTVKP